MDLEVDELGRDLGVALAASLCPAKLDRDGAAVNPTELAQPQHEGVGPLPHGRSSGPAQEPIVGSFADCRARAASGTSPLCLPAT